MSVQPKWRECELAWGSFLASQGYAVTHLNEAVGNTPKTLAPLITVAGNSYRAPDFQSTHSGKSEYWEIKYRSQMDVDPLTGENEFWMSHDSFRDYAELSVASQTKIWIVLYCQNYKSGSGQWLRVSTNTVNVNGRRKQKILVSGDQVDAWVWPAAVMEVFSGPPVTFQDSGLPPIPVPTSKNPVVDVNSNKYDLEALAEELRLPSVPQYSVLVFANSLEKIQRYCELPRFGIRLFLFAPGVDEYLKSVPDYEKYIDSRLIEFGSIKHESDEVQIVDGLGFDHIDASLFKKLVDADKTLTNRFNLLQFRIVHAPSLGDVMVKAGAGTGKTETMSERIMFLLSTYRGSRVGVDGEINPVFLLPKDITLITFTREAAREMRRRITRVMVYRQRLCPNITQPINAWMMQIPQMDISTIHSFAKNILKLHGANVGLKPDFKVSKGTLDFRRNLHSAMSPLLVEAYDTNRKLPAAHLFEKFIERLWEKVENHGFDLVDLIEDADGSLKLAWSSTDATLPAKDRAMAKLIDDSISSLADLQRQTIKRSQTLTTNQLVPTALQTLRVVPARKGLDFKFVFVDEFQDTDSSQIEILVSLKSRFGSNLFVVGDKKQGIYKFRGAQGDALDALANSLASSGFPAPKTFGLLKNFRSGAALLKAINPIFESLNTAELLDYSTEDRLQPGLFRLQDKSRFEIAHYDEKSETLNRKELLFQRINLFKEANPTSSMAILCRYNRQALEIQTYLKQRGQQCSLVVGGKFYQSATVQELHTFLSAVLDPSNSALAAQVLTTRWAGGLCKEHHSQEEILFESDTWLKELGEFLPWTNRIAEPGSPITSDLSDLQARLMELQRSGLKMSFLDWLVRCEEVFQPTRHQVSDSDDKTTRKQYSKNFDHLITQLDQTFINSPISIRGVRDWLQVKIATDNSVDEPMLDREDTMGIPLAITVHKSKGLEFDLVLVPFPEAQFRTNDRNKNVETIVAGKSGQSQVLWKWTPPRSEAFSNVSSADQVLWDKDDVEIIREEARLLYVALTRACNELVVYAKSTGHPPKNSWLHMIKSGGY
jgi:ATP-dependent exoDNAse (exonuclease V) beta subunit